MVDDAGVVKDCMLSMVRQANMPVGEVVVIKVGMAVLSSKAVPPQQVLQRAYTLQKVLLGGVTVAETGPLGAYKADTAVNNQTLQHLLAADEGGGVDGGVYAARIQLIRPVFCPGLREGLMMVYSQQQLIWLTRAAFAFIRTTNERR